MQVMFQTYSGGHIPPTLANFGVCHLCVT